MSQMTEVVSPYHGGSHTGRMRSIPERQAAPSRSCDVGPGLLVEGPRQEFSFLFFFFLEVSKSPKLASTFRLLSVLWPSPKCGRRPLESSRFRDIVLLTTECSQAPGGHGMIFLWMSFVEI